MKFFWTAAAIFAASPVWAVDLLSAPPPCPAPADLADGSAELDPRREAAAGIVPADISAPGRVNLDVPLYLPRQSLHGAQAAAGAANGPAGTVSTAGASAAPATTASSVETDIPIGGVAIRDSKAVSVQAMGQEYLGSASGHQGQGAPGCR